MGNSQSSALDPTKPPPKIPQITRQRGNSSVEHSPVLGRTNELLAVPDEEMLKLDLNARATLPVENSSGRGSAMSQDSGDEQQQDGQVVPTFLTWNGGGEKVYVAGTFNGWTKRIKMNKSVNDFSTIVNLPPGPHRIKFIVDGEWKNSSALETATDSAGNLVNYIEVAPSHISSRSETNFLKKAAEVEYTSKLPEIFVNPSAFDSSKYVPPSLPPHLEKVILNHSSVAKDDASVLPSPNHVVLNHLAAGSIKQNVLAVSVTTRYNRKYQTTILYKPVDTNPE